MQLGLEQSVFSVICSPCALSWQPYVNNFWKRPGFHKLKALFPWIKQQNIFFHDIIAVKTSPGSCVGKPKASEGLMHLTDEGRQAPSALGFPTQLPGLILIPITQPYGDHFLVMVESSKCVLWCSMLWRICEWSESQNSLHSLSVVIKNKFDWDKRLWGLRNWDNVLWGHEISLR